MAAFWSESREGVHAPQRARESTRGLTRLALVGCVSFCWSTSAHSSPWTVGPPAAEIHIEYFADILDDTNGPRWAALRTLVANSGGRWSARFRPVRTGLRPTRADELRRELTLAVGSLGLVEVLAQVTRMGAAASVRAWRASLPPRSGIQPEPTNHSNTLSSTARELLEALDDGGDTLSLPIWAIHGRDGRSVWFEGARSPSLADLRARLGAAPAIDAEPDAQFIAGGVLADDGIELDLRYRRAQLVAGSHLVGAGAPHHLTIVFSADDSGRSSARRLRPIIDYMQHFPGRISLQIFDQSPGELGATIQELACRARQQGRLADLVRAWGIAPHRRLPYDRAMLDALLTGPSCATAATKGPASDDDVHDRAGQWLDGFALGSLDLESLDDFVPALERRQSPWATLWHSGRLSSHDALSTESD